MASALEYPDSIPDYLQYFGMSRPPFAQLAEASSPIFLSEQYSLLMSHLSTATEQSDCLMVVCGAAGSGKTTLLNRYVASIHEDVSYATFDDGCTTGTQFYCSFLTQLGFADISGSLGELRRITHEFLVHRGTAGDPVLIIIDNAHLVRPSVYEQLRWIAETRVNDRRVLSIVLAGNFDLPRILESPAMRSLNFRNNIKFNIRVYSEEETEDYVRHRLRQAGGIDAAKFSREAQPLIYQLSGGVPKSINVLCNEVLTEAYANETRVISAELVRSVADTHGIELSVTRQKGKTRRKTDRDSRLVIPGSRQEARIAPRDAARKAENDPSEENKDNTPTESIRYLSPPEHKSEVPDVAVKELLEKVSLLSEQLGEVRAEKKQATLDVKARDKDVAKLQKQLELQLSKTAEYSSVVDKNKGEIKQLKEALSETTKALRKSETVAQKFAAGSEKPNREASKLSKQVDRLSEQVGELEAEKKQTHLDLRARDDELLLLKKDLSELGSDRKKEVAAARRAKTAAGRSEKRIEKLVDMKLALQASVSELTKDLKEANKRATKAHALEKNNETLKGKIETKTGQLTARDKSLAEAEDALRLSQKDCDSLRASVAELEKEIALLSDRANAKSKARRRNRQHDRPTPKTPKSSRKKKKQKKAKKSAVTVKALEVTQAGKVQNVVAIKDCQSRVMIGRSEDTDLRLDSKFVSRNHALIFCTDEGVYIEDLNSSNGIVVNSKTVNRCELHVDDQVLIGDFVVRLLA